MHKYLKCNNSVLKGLEHIRNLVKLRFVFHLQIWEGELTESHLRADNVPPSDSALFVYILPENATSQQKKDFFSAERGQGELWSLDKMVPFLEVLCSTQEAAAAPCLFYRSSQNCIGASLISDVTCMKKTFSSPPRWAILGWMRYKDQWINSDLVGRRRKETPSHKSKSHIFLINPNKYYHEAPSSFLLLPTFLEHGMPRRLTPSLYIYRKLSFCSPLHGMKACTKHPFQEISVLPSLFLLQIVLLSLIPGITYHPISSEELFSSFPTAF